MPSMQTTRGRRFVFALVPFAASTLAAVLTLPAAGIAQMPADEVLKDFKITGEFVLELGGETSQHAEVFFSERAAAYLVMAPELPSPIMISPRSRSVESVHLMKVMKKDAGTVDILADAELEPLGPFRLEQNEVVFTAVGKEAKLKPRPLLLGRQDTSAVKQHDPAYAYHASQYSPGAEHLAALREQTKDVRVRVFFGSWCPHCKELVPRILRVADELDGSKVRFEYYGLPRTISEDPEAREAGVHSVPTALVFVDGQEAARLTGHDLETPEATIDRVLGGEGGA